MVSLNCTGDEIILATGRNLKWLNWEWRTEPCRKTHAVNTGRTCQEVLLERERSLSSGELSLGGYYFKSLANLVWTG